MPATALKYKEERKYNYADYLTWDDNQRYEIINGEVYDMSPAPSDDHQAILIEVSRQIGNFLVNKSCILRIAPYDVRFPESIWDKDKIIDVVQPDLVIICDQSKIDQRGCQGAPNFIIEILSPKTAYKDLKIKYLLYELNKVKEYWIIDPFNMIVMVFLLGEDEKYRKPIIYNEHEKLKVTILEGLEIDLNDVFNASIWKADKQLGKTDN